jgi:hypothetical protein
MKRIVRLGVASLFVVLSVFAAATKPAGAALTTCNESAERPFAPWGDNAYYALAPNGSFEDGSTGWSLSGARVTGRNNVLRSGSHSLSLPSGSSATSPAICVKLADPASRFFVRGGDSGKLRVDVVYRTLLGLNATSNLGFVRAGDKWQPGPKFEHELENILGTLALNGDLSASIRFKFTAIGGSFDVDDLFVDPLVQA